METLAIAYDSLFAPTVQGFWKRLCFLDNPVGISEYYSGKEPRAWSERAHSNATERNHARRPSGKGNIMHAFKAWGHGPGIDRIVPVETYKKRVLSHRPGHTIGLDEVREYL